MTNERESKDYPQTFEQDVHAPRPDKNYMVAQWLSRMAIQTPPVPLTQRQLIPNTITGLKRWSCHSKELPPISQIKALHVYDFDNTLFKSPLPNKKIWDTRTIGQLQTQEAFGNGGWWHDRRILEATGEGIEKEEPRAWEGWWNENIAQLVELSMEQDDALTVLLTGRGEQNFADLIKRIVASRKFAFDMICLKPEAGPNNERFDSTMKFKQAILEDLVRTYEDADEIRIYEDRPKHTKGFRDFFRGFNLTLIPTIMPTDRKPITAEVIQVTPQDTTLDPVTEVAEVQRLINAHNTKLPPPPRGLEIKRIIVYTGYLVSHSDTAKLLPLVKTPPHMSDNDFKFIGNNILISYGPAQPSILNKVGGLGCKQNWQVTAIGVYQSTIWAARVIPVPPTSVVHTESNIPYIILAQFKSTPLSHATRIQNWQMLPLDKRYYFQTSVGEKVQLHVDLESDESEHQSLLDQKAPKRKHTPPSAPGPNARISNAHDDNRRFSGGNTGFRGGSQTRGRGGGGGGGGRGGGQNTFRGGRGSNRGGGGGSGRGRGGSGQRGYKSLDDVGMGGGRHNAQRGEPNYDDYVPGGGGYDTAFPSMRGAGGDGGLPYGK